MATDKVSLDSLSRDERKLVVTALELKGSSVQRAMKAEPDDLVKERRAQTLAAINALIHRFS